MSARYRTLTSSSIERAFNLTVQPQFNVAYVSFKGTAGQDFTVFWETGVSNTYTHTGSVLTVTHTYTDNFEKPISVQGAMGKLADPGIRPNYSQINSWGNVTLISDQTDIGTYTDRILAGVSSELSSVTDWPLFVSNTDCSNMFKDQNSSSSDPFTSRLDSQSDRDSGFGWPTYVTGNVSNMSGMFQDAFNKHQTDSNPSRTASLNGWDTSNVTSMSSCFRSSGYVNYLSNWNTINVTDMSRMFEGNRPNEILPTDSLFHASPSQVIGNPGIDQWNVSNVANMSGMFNHTSGYLGNLSQWNTQSVTNLSSTFKKVESNVDNTFEWNTGNVTTLEATFLGANSNIDCSNWNTINVTNMSETFGSDMGVTFVFSGYIRPSFSKRNLSSWNVSNVTNMSNIMNGYSGDPNIDSWDVSNVTTMHHAFGAAHLRASDPGGNPINLDQNSNIVMDPSGWVTNSLTDTRSAFEGSTLDSNLGSWNLSSITTMANMFDDSSMSTENYSKTLIGWANFVSNAGDSPSSITLGAANITYNNTTYTGSPYSDAVAARAYLTGTAGWTISDGGQA